MALYNVLPSFGVYRSVNYLHTLTLVLCLTCLTSMAVADTEEEHPGSDLDTLLRDLTSASFREAADILEQLEILGGRSVLPLMESLAEGSLHYDAESLQLISVTGSGTDSVGVDVMTGLPVVGLASFDLQRIRVNNRLRVVVRDATARINLMQGDVDQRRLAAREMLRNLDASTVVLLHEALEAEEDRVVRDYLELGVAMDVVARGIAGSEAEMIDARVAAARALSGRLESPVRNLLRNLLNDPAASEMHPEVHEAITSTLTAIERRMTWYGYIEELFYGLSMGSILLLAAVGLAVTFGVMGVINMAHGEMLMIGAYTTYVVQMLMPGLIGYSIWAAIPAAFVVAGLVGIFIQRFVIRYLHGRPLETLLATFGISLILQQAVRTIFSPLNRRVVSPDWMSGTWDINPVLSITWNRLYILVFAIIVFMALLYILKKTSLGLQVRAVAQNRAMAKAMGIRTDRVDALTFGLGSGIAGMAGVALSQITNVGPNLGQAYIIDSFMVVVFGGVGNLLGTLVGAFSLGVATKFMEPYAGAVLAKILILVFIVVFIQFRPQGLFPHKGRSAE